MQHRPWGSPTPCRTTLHGVFLEKHHCSPALQHLGTQQQSSVLYYLFCCCTSRGCSSMTAFSRSSCEPLISAGPVQLFGGQHHRPGHGTSPGLKPKILPKRWFVRDHQDGLIYRRVTETLNRWRNQVEGTPWGFFWRAGRGDEYPQTVTLRCSCSQENSLSHCASPC